MIYVPYQFWKKNSETCMLEVQRSVTFKCMIKGHKIFEPHTIVKLGILDKAMVQDELVINQSGFVCVNQLSIILNVENVISLADFGVTDSIILKRNRYKNTYFYSDTVILVKQLLINFTQFQYSKTPKTLKIRLPNHLKNLWNYKENIKIKILIVKSIDIDIYYREVCSL